MVVHMYVRLVWCTSKYTITVSSICIHDKFKQLEGQTLWPHLLLKVATSILIADNVLSCQISWNFYTHYISISIFTFVLFFLVCSTIHSIRIQAKLLRKMCRKLKLLRATKSCDIIRRNLSRCVLAQISVDVHFWPNACYSYCSASLPSFWPKHFSSCYMIQPP